MSSPVGLRSELETSLYQVGLDVSRISQEERQKLLYQCKPSLDSQEAQMGGDSLVQGFLRATEEAQTEPGTEISRKGKLSLLSACPFFPYKSFTSLSTSQNSGTAWNTQKPGRHLFLYTKKIFGAHAIRHIQQTVLYTIPILKEPLI